MNKETENKLIEIAELVSRGEITDSMGEILNLFIVFYDFLKSNPDLTVDDIKDRLIKINKLNKNEYRTNTF